MVNAPYLLFQQGAKRSHVLACNRPLMRKTTMSLPITSRSILYVMVSGVLVAQILKTCQLVDTPLVRFGRVRIEVRLLFVKTFLE